MKKWMIIFFSIFSFLYANCKLVGTVTGLRYSDAIKKWLPQDVDIWACYEKGYYDNRNKKFVINIQNLTHSRVVLSEYEREKLIKALKKAVVWAKKAKAKKVPSFSKELFYFDEYGTLEVDFFTSNKGKQNDVVMQSIDFNNQYEKGEVYLDCFTKVPKLIKILKKSIKVWSELKKGVEAAESFR